MDTNTYAPIPGIEGAADRIAALRAAEHEANRARLAAYGAIRAPFDAAHEAAFETHGSGPESAAAYAALCGAMDAMEAHPDYAPLAAAHDAARAAVPAAAVQYVVATRLVATLLRIHREDGPLPRPSPGADIEAILWAMPDGPLPGLQGWRKVTVSPHGAWNSRREVRLCYGRAVVAGADSEGRCWVTSAADEKRRIDAAKARNKANLDAYEAQLADVREALAVDPALRGTLLAYMCFDDVPADVDADVDAAARRIEAAGPVVAADTEPRVAPEHQWSGWEADLALYEGWLGAQYHRGHLARVCLALDGWQVREGQEGGTITPPWGGVPVGVRGALRLPLEAGRG